MGQAVVALSPGNHALQNQREKRKVRAWDMRPAGQTWWLQAKNERNGDN